MNEHALPVRLDASNGRIGIVHDGASFIVGTIGSAFGANHDDCALAAAIVDRYNRHASLVAVLRSCLFSGVPSIDGSLLIPVSTVADLRSELSKIGGAS